MKLMLAVLSISAGMVAHASVTVKDAWIRATVPQQKATGVFMQLQSSDDVRVIKVQTAVAGVSEIHEMKTVNDVMTMRALDYLDLPIGKTIDLKPGGIHVMLMDLKKQIKEGDTIALVLTVESKDKKRDSIEVKAKARALASN